MLNFLSPVDAISSLALLVVALFGLVGLVAGLRHRRYLQRKHLAIVQVDSKIHGGKITSFLKSIKPPFAFEAAVHQLGRDVHYYVIVPKRRLREILTLKGVKEVEDYHFFHHGGEHLGAYLKRDGQWPDIDLEKIDFSKVNEVGEGVALQLIFNRGRGRNIKVNFRILISAPSSYQAKEILASMRPSLKPFNLIESRGEDFINRVNFRDFEDKESMSWNLAQHQSTR